MGLKLFLRIAVSAWVAVVLVSCGVSSQQEAAEQKAYFDVEAFVQGQIDWLEQSRPEVRKEMSMDGEKEVLQTQEIDWNDELDLFRQADLNKPALRDSYTLTRPDSLTEWYRVKPGENLPVTYLKVGFEPETHAVRYLEAAFATDNRLYRSQKKIRLECRLENRESRLKTYELEGFQKLAISAEKPFSIHATIL